MQATLTAPTQRPTLRNRIADLEAQIRSGSTPDADRPQLLLDLAALQRTLRRGGR